MTAFEESANLVKNINTTPVDLDRQISLPFDIKVPSELLERNFLVLNTTWTNVSTNWQVSFPMDIANVSTSITDVMKKFQFWRAKIHVEVRLQSTPYHQGSLIAGWLPNIVPGGVTLDKWQTSGWADATVLSASTQDSVSFDIPYCHPRDWLVWDTSVPSTDATHSTINIQVLNTLLTTSPNIAATVPILVYASFKDMQVSAMCSQMSTGNKYRSNKEAHTKQSQGIDAKGAVSVASKVLRQMPIVGSVWSTIADGINSFAGDLSKPTSTAATQPVHNKYYGDTVHCAGLNDATPASMYPNPYLNQSPTMFGMETSHMSISNLAKRPVLFDQNTFTAVNATWQSKALAYEMAGGGASDDFLSSVYKCFRYHRGGIKYLFHFCVPAFYSVRFRISLIFGTGTVNQFGDINTRIVDVKGDTWEDVFVPYCLDVTWLDWKIGSGIDPYIHVEMITPIGGSSAPASPVVYMNVFRAGAEDTEFSGFHSWSQMQIGNKYKEPFRPINTGQVQSFEKGLVMPEIAGTVSDMIKKAGTHKSTTEFFPNSGTWHTSPFHFFSNYFMYWRGGRIVRSVHTGANLLNKAGWFVHTTGSWTEHPMENSWVPAYNAATQPYQQEALHIPYYNTVPFYPVTPLALGYVQPSCYRDVPVDATLSLSSPDTITIAGADDFVGLFVVPFLLVAPPQPMTLKKEKLVPKTTAS